MSKPTDSTIDHKSSQFSVDSNVPARDLKDVPAATSNNTAGDSVPDHALDVNKAHRALHGDLKDGRAENDQTVSGSGDAPGGRSVVRK